MVGAHPKTNMEHEKDRLEKQKDRWMNMLKAANRTASLCHQRSKVFVLWTLQGLATKNWLQDLQCHWKLLGKRKHPNKNHAFCDMTSTQKNHATLPGGSMAFASGTLQAFASDFVPLMNWGLRIWSLKTLHKQAVFEDPTKKLVSVLRGSGYWM